ncbi:MAG: aminoglycoside phosphotransferase family protein [Actinomycetota bacterium]
MLGIPEIVRRSATEAGAGEWLRELPALVDDLAEAWGLVIGEPMDGGTESLVVTVTLDDATPAVLKLLLARASDPLLGPAGRHEETALRLADGNGCARLHRSDVDRGALLLERLGPSLSELGLPLAERLEIMCDAASRLWRPAPTAGLPTGATKATWLIGSVRSTWEQLGRPCSERVVEHAIACGERRRAAHTDERAVLVHGDIHQWNTLASDRGFLLVDPDGLLAEPEYDLGILMREDPVELLDGDPYDRARWLAERCDLDVVAIWEWGVIERVSTGLLCAAIGLDVEAEQLLSAAEAVAGR